MNYSVRNVKQNALQDIRNSVVAQSLWYLCKFIIFVWFVFVTVTESNLLYGFFAVLYMCFEYFKSLTPFWQPHTFDKKYVSLYGEGLFIFVFPLGLFIHIITTPNTMIGATTLVGITVVSVIVFCGLSVLVSYRANQWEIKDALGFPMKIPNKTAAYAHTPIEYTIYWQTKRLLSKYDLIQSTVTSNATNSNGYLLISTENSDQDNARDFGFISFTDGSDLVSWLTEEGDSYYYDCSLCSGDGEGEMAHTIRIPKYSLTPQVSGSGYLFCSSCRKDIIDQLLQDDSKVITESLVLTHTI